MAIQSINPFNNTPIKSYQEYSPEQVDASIAAAQEAFLKWRRKSFKERGEVLKKAAQSLRNEKEKLAKIITLEMGKLIGSAMAEVEKCALTCEYFADNAETILKPEIVQTEAAKSYITYNPLGIILAVMPWNFPLWQVFRFAAPALMAGNVGVLKHASNVPGCALAIEEIFVKAGLPEGAFKTLLVSANKVSRIIENPLIKAATLTGSTSAGRALAGKAGEMLKKTVLELGGSDPYIVLEDADLEEAAKLCMTGRLINCGQSCVAAKRFIVVDCVLEKFQSLCLRHIENLKMGDPMKEETTLSPMARIDLRDELHSQVEKSIAAGAECLCGGEIPPGEGAFYPVTILTNVKKGMPAYEDELFGPVASIISVKDEQEAIAVANDSLFGLGAAVFTRDVERGERIAANEIEAGGVFVNDFLKSDPRLPFGGIKMSGYGRELSHYGIKEFVNIKTVYIK